MREIKGGTRKMLGPFAPIKRPRTKMTPRSYCCTTRMAEESNMSRTTTITPITSTRIRVVSITSLLHAPRIYLGEGYESISTTGLTRKQSLQQQRYVTPFQGPGQ